MVAPRIIHIPPLSLSASLSACNLLRADFPGTSQSARRHVVHALAIQRHRAAMIFRLPLGPVPSSGGEFSIQRPTPSGAAHTGLQGANAGAGATGETGGRRLSAALVGMSSGVSRVAQQAGSAAAQAAANTAAHAHGQWSSIASRGGWGGAFSGGQQDAVGAKRREETVGNTSNGSEQQQQQSGTSSGSSNSRSPAGAAVGGGDRSGAGAGRAS